jgi:tripeptide aminopeptidase
MIEGGQGINVIATSAGMWLDLRSEDRASLAQLEQQVRSLIAQLNNPELSFQVEVVGDRPAGRISPDHPLVQGALAALGQVGVNGMLETGSTDANVPLAENCPAVTVGITRGGNAHRLDEYVELEPVEAGVRQLILLTLAAAESL